MLTPLSPDWCASSSSPRAMAARADVARPAAAAPLPPPGAPRVRRQDRYWWIALTRNPRDVSPLWEDPGRNNQENVEIFCLLKKRSKKNVEKCCNMKRWSWICFLFFGGERNQEGSCGFSKDNMIGNYIIITLFLKKCKTYDAVCVRTIWQKSATFPKCIRP